MVDPEDWHESIGNIRTKIVATLGPVGPVGP